LLLVFLGNPWHSVGIMAPVSASVVALLLPPLLFLCVSVSNFPLPFFSRTLVIVIRAHSLNSGFVLPSRSLTQSYFLSYNVTYSFFIQGNIHRF
jgi:hypothetical protein